MASATGLVAPSGGCISNQFELKSEPKFGRIADRWPPILGGMMVQVMVLMLAWAPPLNVAQSELEHAATEVATRLRQWHDDFPGMTTMVSATK